MTQPKEMGGNVKEESGSNRYTSGKEQPSKQEGMETGFTLL